MADDKKIIVKTPIIIAARGKAAKIIQEDMKNPNVNRDVLERAKELAKTITVRKPIVNDKKMSKIIEALDKFKILKCEHCPKIKFEECLLNESYCEYINIIAEARNEYEELIKK